MMPWDLSNERMDKTFLFYDTETSGLNPCFDQIFQFAAIRTDQEFNEKNRYQFFIKLNPDVVPSKEAMTIHGISLEELEQKGISEYEAIRQIHQLVNEPGTISIGYNTLNFDDEFLRFSFYRNLLSPYTHQYANFCGRADIYPITTIYFLYNNTILNWPKINNKVSLRLENISKVNQLTDGIAHNAMVDTEASIALAKRLKQNKQMWQYLLGFFDKKIDNERINQLSKVIGNYKEALWINSQVGAENNFQCPVLGLGTHHYYKNQTLWLRLDKPELVETTTNHIPDTTWVYRKKFGEPGILLPTSKRFMQPLSPEREAIMAANKSWLNANASLRESIINYYREFKYPIVEHLDVDAALYEIGFPTPYEEQLCAEFHHAKPEEKGNVIDKFQNPNFRERAIRVMGRHFKNYLPDKYLTQFENFLASLHQNDDHQAWQDFRGNRRPCIPKNHTTRVYDENN